MPKKALCIVAMLLITVTLSAQSGNSDTRARFEADDFTVIRTRTQGGLPVWDLRTPDGDPFSVSMIGALTDARLQAVKTLVGIIYEIDGLDVERTRIIFDEEDRASAIVIPSRFVIGGRAYAEYMPSGMQFIYDDAPAFDFRMLVENLAVRINGAFLTEEQLLVRIERAVENPAAYIQSSDPQFLAEQISELQRLTDLLDVETSELRRSDAALTDAINGYATQGEEAIDVVNTRIDELADGVNTRIDELAAEVESAIEQVVSDTLTLTEQFVKLRAGSIILASRNLFGSLKEVAPETIAAVVALRDADPELTADDAKTQINANLEEGAEPLHAKHVQAIYALFFNDYE